MVHRPPNANASVLAAPPRLRYSGRDSGLRDTEKTGLVVAASFHGSPFQREVPHQAWCVCDAPHEKMALCPKVPSPPGAVFLCDSG